MGLSTTRYFTWWAAVIASVVVAFPLMYQSAKTGFQGVDHEIEDAARVDGASEWKVFFFISIPLASKAIVTGGVLSLARALGEFGATLMFAGNIPGETQTVPTAIYVAIGSGNMNLAWLWVISIVFLSFLMLLLFSLNSKRMPLTQRGILLLLYRFFNFTYIIIKGANQM